MRVIVEVECDVLRVTSDDRENAVRYALVRGRDVLTRTERASLVDQGIGALNRVVTRIEDALNLCRITA